LIEAEAKIQQPPGQILNRLVEQIRMREVTAEALLTADNRILAQTLIKVGEMYLVICAVLNPILEITTEVIQPEVLIRSHLNLVIIQGIIVSILDHQILVVMDISNHQGMLLNLQEMPQSLPEQLLHAALSLLEV
jgi:hypothetical protein